MHGATAGGLGLSPPALLSPLCEAGGLYHARPSVQCLSHEPW